MNTIEKKKISVIGQGKLGACYSAFYADRGYEVLGIDTDINKVNAVNDSKAPVAEPELDELIKKNHDHYKATTLYDENIKNTEVTFMIVPTPSIKNGAFSVDYAVDVAKKMGPILKAKKDYHLLVLVSTVLPEDSRKVIIPAFEKYSGKKCGVDFGYCYSPSLIAIGDIINNLRNPDFLFIGAFDKKAGDMLENIYKYIYGKDRPLERMSIESVELAKISLNSFVTMKITFANILGEICSKIPFADVDEVTNSIGKDKRIGMKFFKSGLGYGGPCFPRDNYAFANMAKKRGISSPLALTTHNINNQIPKKAVDLILRHSKNKKTKIGVLGLSYKPKTTFTEESQALQITKNLLKKKYAVIVFEPLNDNEAKSILKNKIDYAKSIKQLIETADVIFVSNRDKSFENLPEVFKGINKKTTVIDPWGMFTQEDFANNVKYISLGRTPIK
jgi:UDPglucose 6-dehydrogenase